MANLNTVFEEGEIVVVDGLRKEKASYNGFKGRIDKVLSVRLLGRKDRQQHHSG